LGDNYSIKKGGFSLLFLLSQVLLISINEVKIKFYYLDSF